MVDESEICSCGHTGNDHRYLGLWCYKCNCEGFNKGQMLLQALQQKPEDGICAFCLGENDFVDDIGFFYCWPLGKEGYNGPTCRECYFGTIGQMHIAIHGCGER